MLYVLVHQLSVGAVGVRGEFSAELLADVADLWRDRRSYSAVDELCNDDDDGV